MAVTAEESTHWGCPDHRPMCRCFECYLWRKWHPKLVDRSVPKEQVLPADDPRHGTANGYRWWRCRCERCKAAAAKAKRERWNPAVR